MRHCLVVVAGATLLGCGSPTDPAARARLTALAQTVPATTTQAGAVQWLAFTVPLRLENTGSAVLRYSTCGFAIEVQSASVWRTVWAPMCTLENSSPPELAPGQTLELNLVVGAALSGPGGPPWDHTAVADTYRVRADLESALDKRLRPAYSNTFVLIQPQ